MKNNLRLRINKEHHITPPNPELIFFHYFICEENEILIMINILVYLIGIIYLIYE